MMILAFAARALILLLVANAVPWMFAVLCRQRFSAPLDCGLYLPDGRRLLGNHKTWRGLLVGVVAGALAAVPLGLPWQVGAGFALLSLTGDALSSALKRRRGARPGKDIPVLDQLPEAVLPLVVLREALQLTWPGVLMAMGAFMLLDIASAGVRRHTDTSQPASEERPANGPGE